MLIKDYKGDILFWKSIGATLKQKFCKHDWFNDKCPKCSMTKAEYEHIESGMPKNKKSKK